MDQRHRHNLRATVSGCLHVSYGQENHRSPNVLTPSARSWSVRYQMGKRDFSEAIKSSEMGPSPWIIQTNPI